MSATICERSEALDGALGIHGDVHIHPVSGQPAFLPDFPVDAAAPGVRGFSADSEEADMAHPFPVYRIESDDPYEREQPQAR